MNNVESIKYECSIHGTVPGITSCPYCRMAAKLSEMDGARA